MGCRDFQGTTSLHARPAGQSLRSPPTFREREAKRPGASQPVHAPRQPHRLSFSRGLYLLVDCQRPRPCLPTLGLDQTHMVPFAGNACCDGSSAAPEVGSI